jgi:hypothetical protein
VGVRHTDFQPYRGRKRRLPSMSVRERTLPEGKRRRAACAYMVRREPAVSSHSAEQARTQVTQGSSPSGPPQTSHAVLAAAFRPARRVFQFLKTSPKVMSGYLHRESRVGRRNGRRWGLSPEFLGNFQTPIIHLSSYAVDGAWGSSS